MKTKNEEVELQEALRYLGIKSLPSTLQEGDLFEIALAKVLYRNLTHSYIAICPNYDGSERKYNYVKVFAKDKMKIVKSIEEIYPVVFIDKNEPQYKSPYRAIKALYEDGDKEQQIAFDKYRVSSAKKWDSMEEGQRKELINKLINKNIGKKLKVYEERENRRLKQENSINEIKRVEERNKAQKEYLLSRRKSKG